MSAALPISTNAGPRLDRLPLSRFHWRILGLVGAGMFLDGFEIYLAGSVLGVLVKEGWSNLDLNAKFISSTFVGMVIGAWLAGVLGDRYGRRFSYQLNLLIFGIASLVGAAAPSMLWLIGARFFMGLGLGAEIVVGYVTLAEFVPPKTRGRWLAALAIVTNSSLFVSSLLGYLVIPSFGWRFMFVIAGIGALVVWYLRKSMPESPRWLEDHGRAEEAERVLQAIEAEASQSGPLPPIVSEAAAPAPSPQDRSLAAVFSGPYLVRTLVGSLICVAISIAIYGLIQWLPTFFVKQGYSITSSLGVSMLMSFGGPVGAAIGYFISDRYGRRPSIIGTSFAAILLSIAYIYAGDGPLLVLVGFGLISSVYLLIAVGWALYVPELFPTPIRMRGTGVCNTAGRLVTIATPFIVVAAFTAFGMAGVLSLVIGIMLLVCVFVWLLGPETRMRPLETTGSGHVGRGLGLAEAGAPLTAAERPS